MICPRSFCASLDMPIFLAYVFAATALSRSPAVNLRIADSDHKGSLFPDLYCLPQRRPGREHYYPRIIRKLGV